VLELVELADRLHVVVDLFLGDRVSVADVVPESD
jgi:hypothetical protein